MNTSYKLISLSIMLLVSTVMYAQGRGLGRAGGPPPARANAGNPNRPANSIRTTGFERREEARIHGVLNANANASEKAKANANENSVLNPGTTPENDKKKDPKEVKNPENPLTDKDKEEKEVKEKKEKKEKPKQGG